MDGEAWMWMWLTALVHIKKAKIFQSLKNLEQVRTRQGPWI